MNDIKHGIRPIDANALLDAMPKSTVLLRHQVVDVICNSPSIDVAPVVHAHWIKTFNSDGFVSTLRCSECGNPKTRLMSQAISIGSVAREWTVRKND